ncbi:MAG: hypothetical protein WAT27_13035, partial [Chitinophagales bacterium]
MKQLVSAALLLTLTLFNITLFSQPLEWQSRGIGGGGALFAPSVNPINDAEMYIGCDMTEVFHTTNSGLSWNTVGFNELLSVTTSKVQFTSDNLIRYAVNFDFFTEASFPVKSTD